MRQLGTSSETCQRLMPFATGGCKLEMKMETAKYTQGLPLKRDRSVSWVQCIAGHREASTYIGD